MHNGCDEFLLDMFLLRTHPDCKTGTLCMPAGIKYFIDLKIGKCIVANMMFICVIFITDSETANYHVI